MLDEKIKIILPCHFGLESVTKREVSDLGFLIDSVVDGEVKINATIRDIPRLNISLRTCERVLIEIANFKAETFEDLYQGVLMTPFEKYVKVNSSFYITKANQDKNSKLYSSTSIQSITKKAIVDRLMKVYNTDYLPEKDDRYNFRVKFYKNNCSIRLDTTGEGLHKRGYREVSGLAPIEETLAASIIMLTPYKKDRILVDPFCGSGTFLIEAAMISNDIKPGINRTFQSESWKNIFDNQWNVEREKYKEQKSIIQNENIKLFGYDIDEKILKIAKNNAKLAKVDKYIHFEKKSVKDFKSDKKYGFIITNPPYGERFSDMKMVESAYYDLNYTYKNLDNWSMFIITSFNKIRNYLGCENKNRKIYNGMIKTYLYYYLGEKPKRDENIYS